VKLLQTDWGKWRPRTIDELGEALKSNRIEQSVRVLGGVLMELVKKEKIRRWNTNAGYVYILAEKEALRSRGDAE
jgi:predicted transcriptional regulator